MKPSSLYPVHRIDSEGRKTPLDAESLCIELHNGHKINIHLQRDPMGLCLEISDYPNVFNIRPGASNIIFVDVAPQSEN